MSLSNIFKYISEFRSDGHSIGRKVGDLLELIVYSSLITNKKFANKLHIEPKLFGFCDSGHKVEFAITKKDNLKDVVVQSIKNITGYIPDLNAKGGTSDGRFIAKMGTEIVELGTLNETIHQIDEHVKISEIWTLKEIYTNILKGLNTKLS